MSGEDTEFTRPMIPFNCHAMGGCGPGTKRVPTASCGIDLSMDMTNFNWFWPSRRIYPSGKPMPPDPNEGQEEVRIVGNKGKNKSPVKSFGPGLGKAGRNL